MKILKGKNTIERIKNLRKEIREKGEDVIIKEINEAIDCGEVDLVYELISALKILALYFICFIGILLVLAFIIYLILR